MKHFRRICLFSFLIAYVSMGAFAQGDLSNNGYKFWKHKKTIQIHYNTHTMLNSAGGEENAAWSFGLVRFRNIYLHKKPIAQRIKFGIDFGFGVHASHFQSGNEENGYGVPSHYEGPLGYLGDLSFVESEEGTMGLTNIGANQLDIGLKVGPSITINPVGNLRLMAYYHVTPSISLCNSGMMDATYSFVPFFEYGLEVTYRAFGVGIEMNEGVGNYKSLIPLIEGLTSSDEEEGTVNSKVAIAGMPQASKALRLYVALRF